MLLKQVNEEQRQDHRWGNGRGQGQGQQWQNSFLRLARPGKKSQGLQVEEVRERANAQQFAGPGQGQLQHMSSPLARLFAKRGKGNTEEGVEKREERDRKSSSEGKEI